MASKIITDLHGNTYELGDYRLKPIFPKFKSYKRGVYTKNSFDGQMFNLVETAKHIYGVFYNLSFDMYVVYKLKYISYNELKDIRKSYLHGNQHNSKVSQTNGINRSIGRVSKGTLRRNKRKTV